MPDSERKDEPELWAQFEGARPKILGALLTGLSVGLRRLPTIKANLPRMATFARFVMGCETAFWDKGTFAAAYEVNAQNAVADALDANISVSTFRDFMEDCPNREWKGTATQLHAALTERIRKPERDANEAYQKAVAARNPDLQVLTKAKLREAQQAVRDVMGSGFPKEPNGLTHELRKAGPQLRKIGIAIAWPTNNRDRDLSIVWERPRTKYENSPSPSSQPSQTEAKNNKNNDLGGKVPGRSRPGWEGLPDPDSELADSDRGADASQNGEGQWEGWEGPGKIMGQTENTEITDNQLKEQANSTREKTGEDREGWEDECVNTSTRAPTENVSAPDNPKNERKPAKRIIPL